MLERRRNFMVSTAPAEIRLDDDILFSDFMLKWLEVTKSTIQITTYASYQGMVERVIVPLFPKAQYQAGRPESHRLAGLLHQAA